MQVYLGSGKKRFEEGSLCGFIEEYEWPIIGFFTLIFFILGVIGFYQYEKNSIIDALYLSWQLFILESGASADRPFHWTLNVARFGAPIMTAIAILKAILALTRAQLILFRLKNLNNHYIICGLGDKGIALAKDILKGSEKKEGCTCEQDKNIGQLAKPDKIVAEKTVIAIEQNINNDELSELDKMGVIILIGQATDPLVLKKAGIERAKRLYALTGNDYANIEIAEEASKLLLPHNEKQCQDDGEKENADKDKFKCFVHIYNHELRYIFTDHEIYNLKHSRFEVAAFNHYEVGMRKLFIDYPPEVNIGAKGAVLNTLDEKKNAPPVHLLIVGCGWMGRSLIRCAALLGHYANQEKIKISIIDKEEETMIRNHLSADNTSLDKVVDMSIYGGLNVETLLYDHIAGIINGQPPLSICYVCVGNEILNIATARKLNNFFKADGENIHIISCMTNKTNLSKQVDKMKLQESGVTLFNLINETICVKEIESNDRDNMAIVCHQDYLDKKVGFSEEQFTDENKDADNLYSAIQPFIKSVQLNSIQNLNAILCEPELFETIGLEQFMNRLSQENNDKIIEIKKLISETGSFRHKKEYCRLNKNQFLIQKLNRLLIETRFPDETPSSNVQKDRSAVIWDDLEEAYRDSNRYAADHIQIKLRTVNCDTVSGVDPDFKFKQDEIETLARMEHNRWNAEKWLTGWTFAESKSNAKQKTPYLVPFDMINKEDVKKYDRNQVRNIPNILTKVGKRIVRKEAPQV